MKFSLVQFWIYNILININQKRLYCSFQFFGIQKLFEPFFLVIRMSMMLETVSKHYIVIIWAECSRFVGLNIATTFIKYCQMA